MVNLGHGSSLSQRPRVPGGSRRNTATTAVNGGRRERRKREVYQRIRDAALELFRQQGFEGTTVEAIAERADVAKGTFFNYFRHKEALLAVIGQERIDQLAHELGPVESWQGSGEAKLRRLFVKLAELVAADRELSKVMFFETMRNLWLRSTDVRHLWVRSQETPAFRELRGLVHTVLASAQAKGELRDDVDLDTVSRLLESAWFAAVFHWLTHNTSSRAFRRDLDISLDVVFRGLSATRVTGRRSS